MSAFVGIVDFDGAPPDREALRRAAAEFPDTAYEASQFVFGSCFGFGLRPLRADFDPPEFESIVDDARFVAVGDARIDGRAELLRVLDDPRLSRASSDADLVASAFGRWGGDLARHLTGEFAIVVWDGQNHLLHFARDHFGARPIYYARFGSKVAVASSTSALRKLVEDDGGVHPAAVADYIVIGELIDKEATWFRNLRAVPAAHSATLTSATTRVSRYWDLPVAGEITASSGEEIREELMHLLRIAVRDRLRSDRASVKLSGGLDSTSVAVLVQDGLSSVAGALAGVNVSVVGLLEDEEPRLAAEVGAFAGFPVETIELAEFTVFGGLDAGVTPLREWPAWGAWVPEAWRHMLLRHAALGPIAFSGDGGDYVLAVERRPFRWWWWKRDVRNVARAVGAALGAGIRVRFGLRAGGFMTIPSTPIPVWLDAGLVRESGVVDRAREQLVDESPGSALPRPRMRALVVRSGFERTFEYWHPTVTGVPLRSVSPWFDLRLIEAALFWAPYPWMESKRVLRDAMKGRLPREVLQRPKRGLAGDPLEALVRSRPIGDPGIRGEDLQGLCESHLSTDAVLSSAPDTLWQWCRAVEVASWRRRHT